MSEQQTIDQSLAASLREYGILAWERGQEQARLLEGLRVACASISRAPAGAEADAALVCLLMQFGAAREASARVESTLSCLEERLLELRVVAPGPVSTRPRRLNVNFQQCSDRASTPFACAHSTPDRPLAATAASAARASVSFFSF